MIAWIASWWFRPTAVKPQEPEKKKIVVLPRGRHTLSPYRLLEWWSSPATTLDPLPAFPESPRK